MSGFSVTFLGTALLICAVSISPTKAQEAPKKGWLCIADKASGFKYDPVTRSWDASSLQTDHRYLVREPTSKDYEFLKAMGVAAPVSYVVVEFGDPDQFPAECPEPPKENGLLLCGSGLNRFFALNTKRLRMQRYYGLGYVQPGATIHCIRRSVGNRESGIQGHAAHSRR
jgi:hypothetical protein